jgi:hypothetical protein
MPERQPRTSEHRTLGYFTYSFRDSLPGLVPGVDRQFARLRGDATEVQSVSSREPPRFVVSIFGAMFADRPFDARDATISNRRKSSGQFEHIQL